MGNPGTMSKLKELCQKAEDVLSVCGGAFLVKVKRHNGVIYNTSGILQLFFQAAGILKGRQIATYWRAAAELREAGVNVVEERVVQVS